MSIRVVVFIGVVVGVLVFVQRLRVFEIGVERRVVRGVFLEVEKFIGASLEFVGRGEPPVDRRIVPRLCVVQTCFRIPLIRGELFTRVVGRCRIFLICIPSGEPREKLLAKRQKVSPCLDLAKRIGRYPYTSKRIFCQRSKMRSAFRVG